MPKDGSALPVDARVPTEMMEGLYLLRLVDEGLSIDTAMELIVSGMIRPN